MGIQTTQANSLAHITTDPLRNFKFQVSIYKPDLLAGKPQLGFQAVSGLSMTTDVVIYRTGQMNTTSQKLPGQTDFSPVTLTRGLMCGDQNLVEWQRQIFRVMQGTGGNDGSSNFRSYMDIFLLDHPVTTSKVTYKAAWRVYNAWPVSVAFGDLDAGGNGVELQQITFAHEGWDFRIADQAGNPGSGADPALFATP